MAMKRLLLTLMLLGTSLLIFAQDYPFSVVKSGTGKQAVIFIPGFACSGDVWAETVSVLKDSYTCYVLTMAGFSGVAPILMGHSMGGGLTLAIAAEFPELTGKIVIVDALPCLMALTVPDFKSAPDNDCTDLIDRITAMDEEQFVQMQRMSAATLTTDSLRFAEIVSWGLASDRKTYAKLFCDFSNTDLRECIKNIVVPSLVLLEPYFKHIDTVIKNQYKNLSVAQIRYADKGLHFVMFDDREWFIHQICEFIKER